MTDPPAPTRWQRAAVVAAWPEGERVRALRLRTEEPLGHVPGQHLLVRLTAPDGYQASRAYSIASAPDGTTEVEVAVERLEGGEVSGYLHDVAMPGDELEVRGPIGGWFTWDGEGPALLVGGGSGVVPLVAMLRHARRTGRSALLRLVTSVRTPADVLYGDEMVGPEVEVLFTRATPPGWSRPAGRLAADDLPPVEAGTTTYVCGSAAFCDHVTGLLAAAGVPAADVRVERFGATGPA